MRDFRCTEKCKYSLCCRERDKSEVVERERREREHNTVALKTTRKVFPQHLHFRPKEIFRKFKSLICKQKMAPQLSFCFVRWSIAHLVCLLYCAPKICNFHHRRRYQRPYYHDECQQYSPHWWCGPGGR